MTHVLLQKKEKNITHVHVPNKQNTNQRLRTKHDAWNRLQTHKNWVQNTPMMVHSPTSTTTTLKIGCTDTTLKHFHKSHK